MQQRHSYISTGILISSSIIHHYDIYEVNKILWERKGNTMVIKDLTCNFHKYYIEGMKDYNSNFMCISKITQL